MLEAVIRDTRHAARALVARPTYAVLTITTLALVIGAATAVIAVVNATMFRPLPFPAGDRIVKLFTMPPGTSRVTERNPLHPRSFYRFRSRDWQAIGRIEGIWARERALGIGSEPESVSGGAVSAGFLTLLSEGPAIGRTFTEDEDRTNAKVVVLSHGLWQRRFGGDQSVIGRTVTIDRESHQVIGVMPRGFSSAFVEADLWTALNITEGTLDGNATFIQTFARLQPVASLPQLMSELVPALDRVIAEAPNLLKGWRPDAAMLRDAQFGQQRPNLLALVAAVLALAAIACANLANLTLAQVLARRSEHALRAALGGGRAAIVRLQVVETLLLIACGTAAGVLLGTWLLPLLLALDPTTARFLGEVRLDWRVQTLTIALALAVGLVAGVVPVWRALRGDVASGLADANRRTAGSRAQHRVRQVLLGAEAAIAVVLLVCGALLLSGFAQTAGINPGFEPEGLLGAQMRLSASAYPSTEARAAFITRVLERVREVPGVEAAASTLNPFRPGFFFVTLVKIEGQPTPDGLAQTVQFRRISPDYFRTMRIPILRGRDFLSTDGPSTPLVTIVSRSFAERFWPGEDPIGRRVERGAAPQFFTVIGVVEDVSDVGLNQAPAPTFYLSYGQNNVAITPTSLVVRATGDPLQLAGAIRAAVLSVDPAQPIDSITALEQFLADSLGPQRFRSTLLVILGLLGLAIAAVGIYGMTARAVAERTRELGVRLALGATPSGVLRLVVRQALGSVVAGLLAGVVLAGVAVTMLRSTLTGLEHAATWTAAPAVALLAVVAFAAAVVPARRVIATDPTRALQVE